eukprot:6739270-Pyramimonas_sp.AAC.1
MIILIRLTITNIIITSIVITLTLLILPLRLLLPLPPPLRNPFKDEPEGPRRTTTTRAQHRRMVGETCHSSFLHPHRHHHNHRRPPFWHRHFGFATAAHPLK